MAADVAGRAVVVIDEIADTGQRPWLVAEQVRRPGARRVLTAALVGAGARGNR